MDKPKVRPPTPHSTPKSMVMPTSKAFTPAKSSARLCPGGMASNKPKKGNTSQANTPCTIQYDSQLQLFILLMGT